MLSTLFPAPLLRRIRTTAVLSALVFGAAACSDDPTEPDDEPDVQTVTLTVGASTVTINKTTGAPSGNLVVPAGTSTVTAQWLRPNGSNETLITDAEFDLRIVPSNTTEVTYAPTGARSGTLTLVNLAAGGTTAAQVSLFHRDEQHNDFGPYPIIIQRAP